MDALGWTLIVLIAIAVFFPDEIGEVLANIRKAYDKEMSEED